MLNRNILYQYSFYRSRIAYYHKKNPYLSGDYKKLAIDICYLIENNDVRIEFAKKGNAKLKSFSWNDSFKKLLATLSE